MMTRGDFIKKTLITGAGLMTAPGLPLAAAAAEPRPAAGAPSLMGNRFVTLCIMIRTTPWEVSRDVKLHPREEYDFHTLAVARDIRTAFAKNNPRGRLTWGFTLNALEDKRPHYADIRKYAAECQAKHGDEVTYFPGYFPAMYLPRERINRETSEALEIISDIVGGGYRPQCIIGGFLPADTLRHLAQKEGIHAAHGVIWSQHEVDGGGADGSPSYPYYPSAEHFCKPAQGANDFIDCVNLDGWSVDFLCAKLSGGIDGTNRFNGASSRRGVGPIETFCDWGLDLGLEAVMHTQALHFDRGFALNGFGWIPNIWEASLVKVPERRDWGDQFILQALEKWVGATRSRWPEAQFVTFGEYGELWRRRFKDNTWNYRFEEKGLGIGNSYANEEIQWFMNRQFRLALLRNWHRQTEWKVIDFTRYDLPAKEPPDPSPAKPVKDWSLINRINQKGLRPQDTPVSLKELTADEQGLIARHYPQLLGS